MQKRLFEFVEGGELAVVDEFEAPGFLSHSINPLDDCSLFPHGRDMKDDFFSCRYIEVFLSGADELAQHNSLSKRGVEECCQKMRIDGFAWPNDHEIAAVCVGQVSRNHGSRSRIAGPDDGNIAWAQT